MTDPLLSIADRNYDKLSDDVTQFDPPVENGVATNYLGKNSNPDATDDDPNWIIKKFVYSGANLQKIIKKKGSWTGRVALFT